MMDAARVSQERSALQIVQRSLVSQHKNIMRALGTDQKSSNDAWEALLSIDLSGDMRAVIDRVEDILGQTIDWPAQDRIVQSSLRPVWQSAYGNGAQLAADAYKIGIQQPALTQYVLQAGAARVKSINETTRSVLAKTIAEGISEGDGRQQLIDRVQEAMPGVSAGRANMIAANEVHTSLMSGNFDSLKAAGYRTKTWLTAGDADVRSSHQGLNGVTIGIDERFRNGLLYPGDPSGPPGEIINCRCDLVAGEPISEEADEAQDRKPVEMSPVSFFNTKSTVGNDYKVYKFSKLVEPEEGYEDVFIHGGPQRFYVYNEQEDEMVLHPETMAELLRGSQNYKGGNIRLCSCNAGREPEGAAQQLADALGVEVKAPNRLLIIDSRGKMIIADKEEDPSTYGEWIVFKPRR